MEEARRILPVIHYHDKVVGSARLDGERVVDGVREWDPGTELPAVDDDEYLERLPIGDPDTVVNQVGRYHELGINHYSAYTSLGQPQRDILRSLELFAQHVIPRFRDGAPIQHQPQVAPAR
jgi:alkanesulfonate monooxygenase SsuD/methylene tetrahydromethanopterin reductase-like flavin-dependent oxidoreductase (luciferase family)